MLATPNITKPATYQQRAGQGATRVGFAWIVSDCIGLQYRGLAGIVLTILGVPAATWLQLPCEAFEYDAACTSRRSEGARRESSSPQKAQLWRAAIVLFILEA